MHFLNIFIICSFPVPEYEIVPVHHVRRRSVDASYSGKTSNSLEHGASTKNWQDKRPKPWNVKPQTESDNGDSTQNLRLRAFGQPFNLSLVPTEGVFKKGKLKVFTVEPNATAQHGVEYVEHPEVS